jgi:hypothetical protein
MGFRHPRIYLSALRAVTKHNGSGDCIAGIVARSSENLRRPALEYAMLPRSGERRLNYGAYELSLG